MRIELHYTIENMKIPMEFRRVIVSHHKKTMELYNKDIFKQLYEKGKEKDVVFSFFFSPIKFEKEHIILKDNRVKVLISIADEILGIHYLNAFLQNLNNELRFENNIITLKKVIRKKEKIIESNEVVFKITSPLIIRDKIDEKKSWYYFLDEKGIEILKRNLKRNLKDKYPEKYIDDIKIIPVMVKKVVTSYYGIKMQGTLGIIKVEGKKELLNYLYKSGALSSRKSMGFGYLDIVD